MQVERIVFSDVMRAGHRRRHSAHTAIAINMGPGGVLSP